MSVEDVRPVLRGSRAAETLCGAVPGIVRRLACAGFAFCLLLFIGPGAAAQASQSEFEKGYEAYQRGEFAAALEIWEPLAQSGDPRALYNVGVIYAQGRGVRRDAARAAELWARAAKTGHARAMHNLALAHIAGVPRAETRAGIQDYDTALTWLKKAADKNLADSLYTLGNLYKSGLGVEPDAARAAALFRQAAEGGHPKAQFETATRLAEGDGVKRDVVEALKWYLLAARRGSREARKSLTNRIVRASLEQVSEAAERAREYERTRTENAEH